MHATSNCVKNGAKDIMRDSVLSKLIQDIFHYFIKNLDMEDQLLRTLMFVSFASENPEEIKFSLTLSFRTLWVRKIWLGLFAKS